MVNRAENYLGAQAIIGYLAGQAQIASLRFAPPLGF